MAKRPPLAVILVVIVLCFALGLLNVLLDSPDSMDIPPPAPSPSAIVEDASNLRSVLIVGVNDLQSTAPELRAIWILLYEVSGETLYIHGVPIDAAADDQGSSDLTRTFSWSIQDGLNQEFLDELHQVIPLSPDLIVVNDEVAFTSAVNYLGGVDLEGAKLDGEDVLGFLSLSWEKSNVLLNNQALILEALIPRAIAIAPSRELTELVELIPDHVYLSQDVTDSVNMLTPLRDISPDNVFFILLD
jgi:hypothetical protein